MSADAEAAHVLRLALAVPAATLIAHALGLPIGFLAPVLVLTAMAGLVASFSFRLALLTLLLVILVNAALTLLLTPLRGNTPAYLTAIALALFFAYRGQSHPKLAPVAATAIPFIVLFGPLVPLAADFAAGLTTLLALLTASALAAVLLATLCFPGPGVAPPKAPPAPRSNLDCAVSAAIMTLLIGLTLSLDAQSALRLLMIASGVVAIADRRLSQQAAAAMLLATIFGVIAAAIIRNLTFVAQTPLLAGLLMALIVLLIGRPLVRPATAPVASTGLVTLIVLLGDQGDVADSKLLLFLLYTLGGVAIAIGLRHTLLWHLGERTLPAAIQGPPAAGA